MDSSVTIDVKGRILIPKEMREKLNLKPGVKLIIKIEDGRLVLLKSTSLEDFQSEIKSFQQKLKKLTTEPIPTEKLF
ncbi:MAG: AbrB/MazE/SpoVT family DNA-binding domain-containing protein [Promethearchaeota archaeon]|nr:MAG: AbrB/MazE/SpoVT family DNA-binding domain-containing protein [Candidatus Lokiarchaeota archaeon]